MVERSDAAPRRRVDQIVLAIVIENEPFQVL